MPNPLPSPPLLHRLVSHSQLLVWLVILLSALVCAMVAWLHYQQRQTLQLTLGELEHFRQARLELSKGFLHVSLSDTPGSPFNQITGLALLNQAITTFEKSQLHLTDPTARLPEQFRSSVDLFRRYLLEWKNDDSSRPSRIIRLRLAMNDLERQADRLDAHTQSYLQGLVGRLDHHFRIGILAAAGLLIGICVLVILLEQAKSRIEATSQENATRFRLAMEATKDGLWDWQPASGEVYYSPGYRRMLGYSEEDFPGLLNSFLNILHPGDKERALAANQDCIDNLHPNFEVEFRLRAKDGSWRWILGRGQAVERDSSGRALRLVGTHVDITERKRMEEALRDSEANYKFVVGTMQESLSVLDLHGTFLFANNRAARNMIQGTPEQLVSRNICQLVPAEQCQQLLASYRQASASGQRQTQEIEVDLPQGKRWFFNTLQPIHYGRSGIPAVISISMDITARKQAEQEGQQLREQLYQAQKLESVGRLTGGVAHDFNNILSVISGYTEMALERVNPDSPLHGDLEKVYDAAQRSVEIVKQLLAFSRRQTIAPRVLDLNGAIESSLKMLGRLIGEDIDLRWLPASSLPAVKMDPSQIDQIMINLAVNARDAISGQGQITIETEQIEITDDYCQSHLGFIPGRYAVLTFSDNGCGMSRDVQEKIFEPFFTTKGLGSGTGLGLSTVYGIVKQNEGFINVYSEPGEGSTFKIYLPENSTAADSSEIQPVLQEQPGHDETVLVVEDDPAILELAAAMLTRLGYQVLTAARPQTALELARQHPPGTIQLLLTDVIMPEMNGKELASQLLQIHPGLLVVYMSGYTANVIAHHGTLDEGIHFIQKPFSINSLAAVLSQALDHPPAQRG